MILTTFTHGVTVWGWVGSIFVVAAVGYFVKQGAGGQAIGILRDANEVLAKRNEELRSSAEAQAARITELERTRTLEPIVAEVAGLAKSIEQILGVHEHRAQERHEGQLRALEAITARLQQLDPPS